MKEVLKELTKNQIEFICKECLIPEEKIFELDEDDVDEYIKVFDDKATKYFSFLK